MDLVELYIKSGDTGRQESLDSNAPCHLCIKNMTDITEAFRIIADYLCFECKLYLCAKCYTIGHAKHTSVCATGETKEREKNVEHFVGELLNETRKLRRKEIKTEKYNPAVVDRINIQHELDQKNCDITGLCGLNSGRLVVSDFINRSIKMIKLASNVIECYIRLSSPPFDVTEISVNQTHTDSDSATSKTCFGTEETQLGSENVLAVTVPLWRSIVYINLRHDPATCVKIFSTGRKCYAIEFCNGRIFTTEESSTYRYIVCILSIDGTVLKRIENMLDSAIYRWLAIVSPAKIYTTGSSRDTVICMNEEGVIMSQITTKGFDVTGISAGNDKNIHVYVCSRDGHNVYRMDAGLKQCRPVLDKKYSRHMNYPYTLSCFRDKMYVTKCLSGSGIRNFVTVVRLYE